MADTATMAEIRTWLPDLVTIRRDIHAHPEMGLEEVRTAALVSARLREWGVEVTEGVGKTGVVGTIRGKLPGQRSIGLRADMDALADHRGDRAAPRLHQPRRDARLRARWAHHHAARRSPAPRGKSATSPEPCT